MGQGTLIAVSVIVLCCVARSTVIVTRHYNGDIYHERQGITGKLTYMQIRKVKAKISLCEILSPTDIVALTPFTIGVF